MRFSLQRDPDAPPPVHVTLASQSIGRKQLLEKLGIPFRAVHTNLEEEKIQHKDPVKMIAKRAKAKAEEVVKNPRVYMLDDSDPTLIIAADSMAVYNRKAYGKVVDREDAKVMLGSLMGKTHTFVTSVSMVLYDNLKGRGKSGKRGAAQTWNKTIETKVTLRKMTKVEVDLYVTRYDFTRFAAGYTLNETPWDLVTKIDGSFTNVIGLPFEVLLPVLRKLEVIK